MLHRHRYCFKACISAEWSKNSLTILILFQKLKIVITKCKYCFTFNFLPFLTYFITCIYSINLSNSPFHHFLFQISLVIICLIIQTYSRMRAHSQHGVENAFTFQHLLITLERWEYWWQCLDEKLLLDRHCHPRNYRSRNDYWLATMLITTTGSDSVHCVPPAY